MRHLFICLLVYLSVVASPSCKSTKSATKKIPGEPHVTFNNHFNSLIEGQILEKFRRQEKFDQREVYADVLVLDVIRNGQNYHGQFHTGDTLRIYFEFTLHSTKDYLPELNHIFPGLDVGDVFQAELVEKMSGSPQYKVIEYKFVRSL